ncbi:MAG: ELM1/GtrOC1 family putative glycosyltransferase [Hydrotalea sp.]|nr:ELM1/GtrOC1 family putative glycosyltransferase [Hydrotalea sp.]
MKKTTNLAEKKILLLFDKNRGHQQQLIALVEALGTMMPVKYEMVRPQYNWWAKVPALSARPWFSGMKDFSTTLDRVDAVFSAGHITARPALFLKTRLAAAVAVHLLSPNGGGRFFDLLVRPLHECKKSLSSNMMVMTGGLSAWDKKNLQAINPAARATAKKRIPTYSDKKTTVSILLGGNSRLQVFKKSTARNLLAEIKKLADRHFVLITPSARTPSFVQLLLQKELSYHGNVWLDDGRDHNVYGMILSLSDVVVVTNDSVNMMTEGLLTGKQTLLWPMPLRNFLSLSWQLKKLLRHLQFIKSLKKNFAVENYNAAAVDKKIPVAQSPIVNSEAVAREVKKRFLPNNRAARKG